MSYFIFSRTDGRRYWATIKNGKLVLGNKIK
jgi:hypothetical protein